MVYRVWTLIRGLLQRRSVARELDDELRFHVEMETRSHISAGMGPEEARRIALRDFGGVEQTKEAVRDVRTIWLDSPWQDLRFALRMLLKHRLSTTLTLVMLAFGLGANTALFTVSHAWLLSPYPYPQPGRLVTLEARSVKGDVGAHYRDVLDWRDRSRSFEEIAIIWSRSPVLTGGAEAVRVRAQVTTASAAQVLGINPVIGRFFTPVEDAPGAPYVALVSRAAWQHRFGHRPDILGSTAVLDGRPHTIIGVMPDRAALPQRTPPDVWIPLRGNAAARGGQQYYELMARLKPGVTLEQARADMTDVSVALEREDPSSHQGWRVTVAPAASDIRERHASTLMLLFSIAGCLLLLVVASVTGMMLVRSAQRAKELTVRAALGARRWRLIQPILLEGVLVGAVGGALALLVADWLLVLADGFHPNRGLATMPRLEWSVLVFAAAASVLTGVLFGLWPAVRMSRVDLSVALKAGPIGAGRRGSPTRVLSALVVVEVALATALLVAGALMTKDLLALQAVDTGVRTEGAVTFRLALPSSRYASDEQRVAVTSQLIERLRSLAGMEAAAAIGDLPMGGDKSGGLFAVESASPDPQQPSPRAILDTSSPGYFRAMGIRVLQGRDFGVDDRSGTLPVAIVSDRLVDRYLANRNPIGERVRLYGRVYTIVGVVGTVRHDGPRYEPTAQIYFPLAQSPSSSISFIVRMNGTTRPRLDQAIRQAVGEIDPDLPVERLQTMDEVIQSSLLQPRLSAQVLMGLGAFGLALALTGLYGVIAYAMEQRTREIAIRVSLGAASAHVARMVLWRGVRLAGVGVLVGVPVAFGLSHILNSTLTTTSPRDIGVFTIVPTLLVVAALAASYIPARRALRIDPAVALRGE